MANYPRITVAELTVSFDCNDAILLDKLVNHYSDFLSYGNSDIHLKFNHEGNSEFFQTKLEIHNDIVKFINAGFNGIIDIDRCEGNLIINNRRPIETVDYALRVVYSFLAHKVHGFLFRAAGIVRNKKAYLFAGHSGCGKTTASKNSLEYQVLNDDLLVLRRLKDEWMVFGTPFWNPTQVKPSNANAKLAGIYFLVQDKQVFLEPISTGQALAEFIASVPVISIDPVRSGQLFQRGLKMFNEISAYRLHFLPDNSFWKVIQEHESQFNSS